MYLKAPESSALQITIQECQDDDLGAVCPIVFQLRTHLDKASFRDRIRQAKAEGYRIFYAKLNNIVVGAIGFRVLNDLCWGRNLYVDDLVVDESMRRKGIGTALMKFVKERAVSEKCQYVRLASGVTKTEAHRFYESLGYRKTSFAYALSVEP